MTVPAHPAHARAHSARCLSCCAILAAILSSSAIAQVQGPPGDHVTPGGKTKTPPPVRIEQVGAWGGPVNCFAREGNIGVVGSGERLVALDMSDPMHLVELGTLGFGSAVMDVKVHDGFAYVTTAGALVSGNSEPNHLGRRIVHIVDVHDPGAPARVWSGDRQSFFHGEQLELYGNANGMFAIVRLDGNIAVVEVSDPLNPVMLGYSEKLYLYDGTSDEYVHSQLNDMFIQGDLMYAAADPAGVGKLLIFDLSGIDPDVLPMRPPLVGVLEFGFLREPFHVVVEGERVYAVVEHDDTSDRHAVYAIDASDPTAPTIVGEYDLPYHSNSPPGIDAVGGIIYVTDPPRSTKLSVVDQSRGLIVLDMLSDPANPAVLGEHKGRTGAFSGLHVNESTVYLFDRGEGLVAIDAADPANPVRLGGYHSPAELREMQKQGDLLYVSDCWNGFTILDVSDPSRPQTIGIYQAHPDGIDNWGLDVEDGVAYLAAGRGGGLEAVDISDPANPTLLGAMRDPPYGDFIRSYSTGMGGVEVVGDIAYFGATVGGPGWVADCLFSMDVSDPRAIVPIDPDGTILTYDMLARSLEHDPQRELFFATGEPGSMGLASVDIADPANLKADDDLGVHYSYRFVASSLDAQRNVLAVVDGSSDQESGGLSLLDVTDPYAPTVLSKITMYSPGAVATHPLGTFVIGRAQAITGDQWTRLILLDTADPTAPELVASATVPGSSPISANPSGALRSILAADRNIYVASWPESKWTGGARDVGLSIYELWGGAQRSADRNRDERIDVRDLVMFLGEFGDGRASADLNGDGQADAHDLGAFLDTWARSR